MRNTTLSLLVLLCGYANATTYYVSMSGTGNGAQNTPWSWNSYINNKNTVTSGDAVLFKASDLFPGPLTITNNNGTSSARITYGRYGAGNNPAFSGLISLISWTASGTTGIYYASLDVERLQIVLVNGVITGPGRWPKNSYLTINSHVDGQSVTSSSISSMPFNPSGGTLVTKKYRYIVDRHPVISKNNSTVFISEDGSFGSTSNNPMTDGNGFFFQDHIGCLTQFGDWYYDNANNRLYMHFGTSAPSNNAVQVSSYRNCIDANNKQYITFDGLDIIGFNNDGFDISYGGNLNIVNCNINYTSEGINALQGSGNVLIDNCKITNSLSNGIVGYEVDRYTITNDVIKNTGLILGMTRSGDLTGSGISITGNYHRIKYNTIVGAGYNGIGIYSSLAMVNNVLTNIGGDDIITQYNFVDSTNINKDDGAGIYSYGSSPKTFKLRTISNNIVLHSIGTGEGLSIVFGTGPFASGIYMDNFSSNFRIEDNFVAYSSGAGIFFNSVNNDTAVNNTFFDSKYGLLLLHLQDQDVNNLLVTNNKFISATASQRIFNFELYRNKSFINSFGTFSNNTFYKPFGGQSQDYIVIDDRMDGGSIVNNLTLQQWQTTYSKDLNSVNSTLSLPNNSYSDFKPLYNFSSSAAIKSFSSIYKDLTGAAFTNEVTLPAYSGSLFVFSANSIINVPPANNVPKFYITPEGKILKTSADKALKKL